MEIKLKKIIPEITLKNTYTVEIKTDVPDESYDDSDMVSGHNYITLEIETKEELEIEQGWADLEGSNLSEPFPYSIEEKFKDSPFFKKTEEQQRIDGLRLNFHYKKRKLHNLKKRMKSKKKRKQYYPVINKIIKDLRIELNEINNKIHF